MVGGVPEKLRIGVLLDGELAPAWIVRLLERVAHAGDTDLVLILNAEESAVVAPEDVCDWDGTQASRTWKAWRGLEKMVYREAARSFELHPLPELFRGVERLSIPKGSDPAAAPLSMFRHLREQHLDVLLQLGLSDWALTLCGVARFGLWRLHSGDRQRGRRGPAGFWEVARGEGATSAVLEMLAPDALDGQVLADGAFASDDHSVLRNRAIHYVAATGMVVRELAALRRLGAEQWRERVAARMGGIVPAVGPYQGMPSAPMAMAVALRVYGRLVLRKLRHRLQREQWLLMYSFASRDGPDMEFSRFRRITPPLDRSWADPFVVCRRGRWYVFFEELVYREVRGVLACLELRADGGWTEPRRVLELPHHLSYPNVFEHEGEWYLVPESRGARRVDLFRATEFPWRWTKVRTLLEDIELVDATLYQHEGRWWMFGNARSHADVSLLDELHLYSTDDLLAGQWAPHPDNPVVLDATAARPAGHLWNEGGRLLRPSQDSSTRYGYGLKLNEVLTLSATEYREQNVRRYVPNWESDLIGMHTINFAGGLTLIDVLRRHRR